MNSIGTVTNLHDAAGFVERARPSPAGPLARARTCGPRVLPKVPGNGKTHQQPVGDAKRRQGPRPVSGVRSCRGCCCRRGTCRGKAVDVVEVELVALD